MARHFDLNTEDVLEHWTLAHALRELIANALDEQALTGTREPAIERKASHSWTIRDWGRGLRYEHLTQNESEEKLRHAELVVGKFGVGLKDALATLDRHDIAVKIRSRHCDITTSRRGKHDFDEIRTLHAVVDAPSDPTLVGTEVTLEGKGLTDDIVDEARQLFLRYAGDEEIGTTQFGGVLRRRSHEARIYVNGLRVATESNFLFSYNITSPTKALRQALNRERSHVSRGAYTDRVKSILLACTEDAVIDELVQDLQRYQEGTWRDETQLLDIGIHACRQLSARRQAIFLTPSEVALAPDFLRRAQDDGYEVIVVPETIRRKLSGLRDAAGNPMRDLQQYRAEWEDSFEFSFVDPERFTAAERAVWEALPAIFQIRGGRPRRVREVRVSETMRLVTGRYHEAVGVWDPREGLIVVHRSQLQSLSAFGGTVLHEVAHALSGAPDMSLEFEEALTDQIGSIVRTQLSSRPAS